MINQNVTATAYRLKLAGTLVITDQFQLGFIHPSERDREPRLGEKVQARVIGIHPDGTLNLSLKPRNYEALGDDAAMILALLQHRSDGQLPLTTTAILVISKNILGLARVVLKWRLVTCLRQA